MTALDAHGTLPAHAERLLRRVESLHAQSVHGRSVHMQHVDHAKRAQQLAEHLRGVLALSDGHRGALALVRAALEHHLMDRLVFLATRHIETYGGIKKPQVAAEEARLASLQRTRPDLERWWWDESSGMNVVWRGYHSNRSKKGRGQLISPYYFRIDDFDPFTGGKKHAAKVASPFWRKAHRQDWAKEAAATWDRYFVHGRVMKAIDVNNLLPGRMRMQVDIHYGFLSGYAHPTKKGYEAFYGLNHPDRLGDFDHYGSEIALLYAITIAAAELDIFMRMCRRQPRLGLRDWEDIVSEVRDARLASSYFWFLGGEPQVLDRLDTVHTPPGETDPKWGRPRRDWRKLRPWEVQYYADPLDRLVRLHHGWSEISSGLTYVSPFQRDDGPGKCRVSGGGYVVRGRAPRPEGRSRRCPTSPLRGDAVPTRPSGTGVADYHQAMDPFPSGHPLGAPPDYTPGPNPALTEFVESLRNPLAPPSAGATSDVVAGKNTYVYDTHTYHTKVPPAAIAPFIEAHSRLGDIVLDPFAGSGMTGVAALTLGRNVVLSELSPAATFIAYNFLDIVPVSDWDAACDRLLTTTRRLEAALYRTTCRRCSQRHKVLYTVWSYRVRCPRCDHEFNYWDVGQHVTDSVRTSKLLSQVECPNCRETVAKGKLTRLQPEPVQIGYRCQYTRGRQEEMAQPNDEDRELVNAIDVHGVPQRLWYPRDALPMGYNTRQPMPFGITSIPDFYTTRNLWAMAALWHEAGKIRDERIRHKMLFALTGLYLRVTKFSEFRFWGGSGNAPRLYVPMVANEQNVFETLRRKMRHIRDHLRTADYDATARFCVTTQSSTSLSSVPTGSIDYVFTDPPFGANINYSEMNFLWESWLRTHTDNTLEAVVNPYQAKGPVEYEDLLARVFTECKRVLKPGGRMTVVFNNSSQRIWHSITSAIARADFSIEASYVLDKKHPTSKQITASNVPGIDVALECSSGAPGQAPRQATVEELKESVREALRELAVPTERQVFARVISRLASSGAVPSLDYDTFRGWVQREFAGEIVDEPTPRYLVDISKRRDEAAAQLSLSLLDSD